MVAAVGAPTFNHIQPYTHTRVEGESVVCELQMFTTTNSNNIANQGWEECASSASVIGKWGRKCSFFSSSRCGRFPLHLPLMQLLEYYYRFWMCTAFRKVLPCSQWYASVYNYKIVVPLALVASFSWLARSRLRFWRCTLASYAVYSLWEDSLTGA